MEIVLIFAQLEHTLVDKYVSLAIFLVRLASRPPSNAHNVQPVSSDLELSASKTAKLVITTTPRVPPANPVALAAEPALRQLSVVSASTLSRAQSEETAR